MSKIKVKTVDAPTRPGWRVKGLFSSTPKPTGQDFVDTLSPTLREVPQTEVRDGCEGAELLVQFTGKAPKTVLVVSSGNLVLHFPGGRLEILFEDANDADRWIRTRSWFSDIQHYGGGSLGFGEPPAHVTDQEVVSQVEKTPREEEIQDQIKRATTGLTFGTALEALKSGRRARRAGWSGKGMWLVLIRAGNAMHKSLNGSFNMQDCIGMKTATDGMQPGWLASQPDMLSEDWEILP